MRTIDDQTYRRLNHGYNRMVSVFVFILLLGIGSAARAETAQSITFNLSSWPQKTGSQTIDVAFISMMTDPNACVQFYGQTSSARSWTWNNEGNNLNPFGIVVDYKISGGNGNTRAFGCVTVDPIHMQYADNTVDILLRACNINGVSGNPGLKVESSSPGVTVKNIGGMPSCN